MIAPAMSMISSTDTRGTSTPTISRIPPMNSTQVA